MAARPLLYGGLARWAGAGALLVVCAALIAMQARDNLARDAQLTALLGGAGTGTASRLAMGSTGLSLRLNDAQRSVLRHALAGNPLDGTAIALAALDRNARGDASGAAALAEQALRVEPRTRLGWLARVDRQMRMAHNGDAAISVLRLLAVDPPQYLTYLPMLAAAARDRQAIAPIAAALSINPPWRAPFLSLLAQHKYDPAVRYALMNPLDRTRPTGIAGDDTAFVTDLVNKGDIERAYLAWVSMLPDDALGAVGAPYDANFAGLPGAAPFNWQLIDAGSDHATIGEGALNVSYAGRQVSTLASQVVMLAPGSYRLASTLDEASSATPGSTGSALTWRVTCLPARGVLGELTLDPAVIGRPQRSPDFIVPGQDCAAVSLALIGTASAFPVRLSARIASVALQQDDGAGPALPAPATGPAVQQ
ncbi:hypothetical protein ACFOKI_12505 [Sphingomonas qilianensis]|uniref:Tetratricopeptide repeat protein n=1 Tax=Sphingomonas qilianensis TaxID=1736690 RepID=A0ABU9XNP6_9SPHN